MTAYPVGSSLVYDGGSMRCHLSAAAALWAAAAAVLLAMLEKCIVGMSVSSLPDSRPSRLLPQASWGLESNSSNASSFKTVYIVRTRTNSAEFGQVTSLKTRRKRIPVQQCADLLSGSGKERWSSRPRCCHGELQNTHEQKRQGHHMHGGRCKGRHEG
jgi:hypothetical protein